MNPRSVVLEDAHYVFCWKHGTKRLAISGWA